MQGFSFKKGGLNQKQKKTTLSNLDSSSSSYNMRVTQFDKWIELYANDYP